MVQDKPKPTVSDREAIKELRAAYGYYIDNHEWEAFRELFVEDAVLDYGENIGRQEGQEGLDFFIDFVDERVEAGAHMIHNPIIDVNGDMATGRWYVDARESFGNGQTGLTTGEYHDTYQRVEGDWKFAKIEFTVHYQFVFDENHDLDKLRRRSPNN